MRIQPDLAKQQIGIIAIKEDSNTAADSTAAKYFRRIGPGKGAHQVDATSERVKQWKMGMGLSRNSDIKFRHPLVS